MRLLVDAQALQAASVRDRGIGRYSRELLTALAARDPRWRIEAILNASLPPPAAGRLRADVPVHRFEPPWPVRDDTHEANERYFGDWIAALRPDAFLELNAFEGDILVPSFAAPRPPVACMAYDLIPLLYSDHYLKHRRLRERYADRVRWLVQSDLVLAISSSTRSDVCRLLRLPEEHVVSIRGGAPDQAGTPTAPDVGELLASLAIDRPFILTVGGADPRKNLRGALAAFALVEERLRRDLLLVIVCALPPAEEHALQHAADGLGIGRALRLAGFVEDEALQALYRASRLVLFPSHYEGLGLPVLEALAAGAPLVAAGTSSVPEFAGAVSHLADPSSPPDMARAIERALADPRDHGVEHRRRHAASFTWQESAARALDAIGWMTSRRRPTSSAPPQIAWVSPLPPTPSGISDYSVDLLAGLADHFDVTAVVSDDVAVDRTAARLCPVIRPGEAMERHRRTPFDLFVYHLGNSDRHVYMLDLLRRHSGLLVLHEVRLGGLALRARAAGAWPGRLADEVAREGARDLADALRRGEAEHARIADEVMLTRGLADASEGVVVHSAWSWQLLRPHTARPLFQIPMGVPAAAAGPPQAARARLGIAPGRFLVVTLGEVTAAKRVDRLLRACGALPQAARTRLDLRVVGDGPPALVSQLRELARELGVAGQLRFEGRVPMPALLDYASAADACVQLRYPARGETSAALLRALSAGAACIVTKAGSFAELPDDAALAVTPLRARWRS
jgi:glycosyltransferase involved in cell wall biosynthesis